MKQESPSFPPTAAIEDRGGGGRQEKLISSKKGFAGALDAGLNLTNYMGNVLPSMTTLKILQPQHFRRLLMLFSHALLERDDHSGWKLLEKAMVNGETPIGGRIHDDWLQFFKTASASKGDSLVAWARMLYKHPRKAEIAEHFWHDDLGRQKLLSLDSSLLLEILDGTWMYQDALKQYPQYRDSIFSRDIGL